MTDPDSTLLGSKAPSLSTHSPMGVGSLSIHRTKVLDSFFIESPPDTQNHDSLNDLLDPPIQVTVLGVDKGDVYLGIYAHPSLVLTKGTKPNATWRQSWNHFADTLNSSNEGNQRFSRLLLREPQEPSTPPDTTLECVEKNVHDELNALAEAHYFFYQMIEALFDSEETRLSMDWDLAKDGLSQWKDWLLMREYRVQHLIHKKYSRTNTSTADNSAEGKQ